MVTAVRDQVGKGTQFYALSEPTIELAEMLTSAIPCAELVKLRFFAGCTLEETAQLLGIARATAQRQWAFARAWLFGQLHQS